MKIKTDNEIISDATKKVYDAIYDVVTALQAAKLAIDDLVDTMKGECK